MGPPTDGGGTSGDGGNNQDGDSGDGNGDNDDSDGMPADLAAAPPLTGGGSDNEDDNNGENDDDNDSNNDDDSESTATANSPTAKKLKCPAGKEVPLFSATCDLIQPPANTQCAEPAPQAALTPSPNPSSSLPPDEIGSEAEVEQEFSVASEGNYASQCVAPLQFGQTGNIEDPNAFLQYDSGPDETYEPGGIEFAPEASNNCNSAIEQSAACSGTTTTPAPSGTEAGSQPNNPQPTP